VFGEARWRSSTATAADLDALTEKALLWLRGDTSRWDVHYAFFARGFGQVQVDGVGDGMVHLFTPEDVVESSVVP
jgi:hypothetical protein